MPASVWFFRRRKMARPIFIVCPALIALAAAAACRVLGQQASPPSNPAPAPTTAPRPSPNSKPDAPPTNVAANPKPNGENAKSGSPGQLSLPVAGGQTPVAPASGPIPPRNPRLVPPKTQETTVPPPVTIPPPPVPTPEDAPRPLTADEAARIALRLQPNVDIALASIYAQRGRTRQVRSALMPQVTVTTGYTYVNSLSRLSPTVIPIPTTNTTGTGTTGGTGTGTGTTGGTGTGTGTTGGTTGGGTTTGGSTGTGTTGSGSTGTGTGTSGGTTGGTTGTGTTGGTTTGGSAGTGTGTTTGTTASPSIVIPSGGAGTAQGFTAQATLRQLVYDFNHTRDLVRQSSALERAAEQNLTRVQFDTILAVKQAYYLYVQNLRLVQVNEQEVANRQAQLDLAQSRYNVGLGLPIDVVNAQTAKAEAILGLSVARDNAQQARITLDELMGIDPRTPITPAAEAEPPLPSDDVNGLTARALTVRPEVLQAQATLRAYQYGVSAAKTTNAPVISGDIGVAARGDQFLPQTSDLTIGVGLTWTPFDGGLTRGRVEEARANVLGAQASLTQAQLVVKADVSSSYSHLRTAEQRVQIALADLANAEEGVRIAEGRYRTGLGLFLDIINAQAFLLTARINVTNTLGAVDQYRAALGRAIGQP